MLTLDLLPSSSLSFLNSKPFKTSSRLPPISSLNLNSSSSLSLTLTSIKTHESYHTNFHIPVPKSKPRSYITKFSTFSAESSELSPSNNSKTRNLSVIFGLWCFQNIIFTIYYKKCLNIFPFPWLLASLQLLVGSIWTVFCWSFKFQPCPKITKPFINALLLPALFHTIGHISQPHVIRSAEPVFSLIFSTFLGERYRLLVWISILPIVFGCSLALITEVSFSLQGLQNAMISNVGFVLRNIYSKKILKSFKEVDGSNLYGWISIISFIYLFPTAVLVEGSRWIQGYHSAIAVIGNSMTFYLWILIAGVFYHLYNQTSYQALEEISALTFSVGNSLKTVLVVVSIVLLFGNPVKPVNALGSGIAVLGTFLYWRATAAGTTQKVKKKTEGKLSIISRLIHNIFNTPILAFLLSLLKKLMGQLLDKLQGKEWRQKQIRKITDKVFKRVSNHTGRAALSFEELYIAVLIVYNDINKYLPGPHFDPPSKDKIKTIMEECDMNLDGELDHEEFVKFIKEVTKDTFNTVSQGLIITLVVAPSVAMATKRATEGVPGVGKVIQKLPVSIYASLVTLAVVAIQTASTNQGLD
ncbi:xylulose 5-phosphate/phosphate translocator, chloroplastic-like [Silene latifolia]|uniref:xylulose 5-phosphate/phosphate translocator, chloroplastic-like n=1 Tax=Silene latifolia TaxID=37657 RepID=UPI003D76B469